LAAHAGIGFSHVASHKLPKAFDQQTLRSDVCVLRSLSLCLVEGREEGVSMVDSEVPREQSWGWKKERQTMDTQFCPKRTLSRHSVEGERMMGSKSL
jgi:hypothetical protein